MSAWVLESAYRYARAAAILRNACLTFESEVNAALAMELLIKSLLVVPEANAKYGTVAQQYSIPRSSRAKDGHNLIQLLDKVPHDLADKVGLSAIRDVLDVKQDVFKLARYIYEPTAPTGSSDILLGHVCWVMPQIIEHFVSMGNTDRWLLYMKQHPEKMQEGNLATG